MPSKSQRWKPLYHEIKKSPIDAIFSWDALHSIIGIDVRRDRDIIYDVNRELLNEGKNILVSVRNHGYKLACPDMQIAHATGRKTKANNQLKQCKKELNSIDLNDLPTEKRNNLVYFINHINTTLNVMEGTAVSGINESRKAIINQEENLAAIRQMKDQLTKLEVKISMD